MLNCDWIDDMITRVFYEAKKFFAIILRGKPIDVSLTNVLNVPKKTVIGDYSSINFNVLIGATKNSNVSIGRFSSIGPGCNFFVKNHPVELPSTSLLLWQWIFERYGENEQKAFQYKYLSIILGNDVWIGANSIVLPGVKIGDGAVIGAGSIVTKDVPPYAIAVGNPAKVKRYRFSRAMIVFLLRLKWWSWDSEKIKRNERFFLSNLNKLSVRQVEMLIVD